MTTTPRTWVVGETVTAALMNQEIRDQFNSFLGGWTSYTPAWTATTTNPTLGNGTIVGRYLKIGRTCHVMLRLVIGSTTAAGSGSYRLSLPATAVTVSNGTPGVLNYTYYRAGLSPNYIMGSGPLLSAGTNTDDIWFANPASAGDWNQWSDSGPWTKTTGDIVTCYGVYQTAS